MKIKTTYRYIPFLRVNIDFQVNNFLHILLGYINQSKSVIYFKPWITVGLCIIISQTDYTKNGIKILSHKKIDV